MEIAKAKFKLFKFLHKGHKIYRVYYQNKEHDIIYQDVGVRKNQNSSDAKDILVIDKRTPEIQSRDNVWQTERLFQNY